MATGSFYKPGEQRSKSVHALFGAIAARYDLINDLQSFGLHRVWKRRLARLADVRAGDCALDVCCGTGDIAIALAKHGANVVGLDFSKEMLAVAQARTRKRFALHGSPPHPDRSLARSGRQGAVLPGEGTDHGLDAHPSPEVEFLNETSGGRADASAAPQFLCGDAMRLPFHDASFDIVTVGYGLRNLADWETGLREMQRVAKPGGRLLVLDFGKPDNAVWRAFYFAYLGAFVPTLGRLFAGSREAYAYILESLKFYPAQHGVAAKMRELNLREVRVFNLLGGIMSIHCGENQKDIKLGQPGPRCRS